MSQDIKGIIFDIKKYALHDGPGIRTTVFFKGCPMQCWWCHNPESRDNNPHLVETLIELSEGDQIIEQTPIGYPAAVAEVITEIKKDTLFYDESGGGVTFSGGEPFNQPKFLKALLKSSKEQGIHTAIDTCGYAESRIVETVLKYTDLFLFDLKIMDDVEHIKYTGVSNELIHKNLQLICQSGREVHLRIPIIPALTDTKHNLSALLDFIKNLNGITEINLLPYHSIGRHKYKRLGMEDKMGEIEPPSPKYMTEIKQFFEQSAHPVSIGG